jgi:hypothetical protein
MSDFSLRHSGDFCKQTVDETFEDTFNVISKIREDNEYLLGCLEHSLQRLSEMFKDVGSERA